MVTTAIRLVCSVNNDTSAVVSARAHGFCSIQYPYEFFLQVGTLSLPIGARDTFQNELTLMPLPC